jgi:hypothetical protein
VLTSYLLPFIFVEIASVSKIHRNFVATAKMVEQLRDMDYKTDRVEKLLAKERASPLGDAPNLLAIHYTLSEMETFRYFSLFYSFAIPSHKLNRVLLFK